jgi:hypothetical protein
LREARTFAFAQRRKPCDVRLTKSLPMQVIPSTIRVQATGVGNGVTVNTVASTFEPLTQATNVYVGQSGGGNDDTRTFVLGGFNGSTLTMNVAAYNPNTGVWTPSTTVVRTGAQAAPLPRFGAAAAYIPVSACFYGLVGPPCTYTHTVTTLAAL